MPGKKNGFRNFADEMRMGGERDCGGLRQPKTPDSVFSSFPLALAHTLLKAKISLLLVSCVELEETEALS